MSYRRYVDWSVAIVLGIAIGAFFAGPAHAAAREVQVSLNASN